MVAVGALRTYGSLINESQLRPRRRSHTADRTPLRPPTGSEYVTFFHVSTGALRDLRLPSWMPSASINVGKDKAPGPFAAHHGPGGPCYGEQP